MPAERVPPFFRGWATNYPVAPVALSPQFLRSKAPARVALTARAPAPHDPEWMDSHDLPSLPAGRAATLIADGALSPMDLLESCLARIAERDAEIRAWVYVDEAGARAAARRAGGHQGHLPRGGHDHHVRRRARLSHRRHRGRGRGGAAPRGGRDHPRQGTHHRVRLLRARPHAQSVEPGAHAGRLVLRL